MSANATQNIFGLSSGKTYSFLPFHDTSSFVVSKYHRNIQINKYQSVSIFMFWAKQNS
jgi:hypothetical protein